MKTIAGVRITEGLLYNVLAPAVRQRVRMWADRERETYGSWPPTVTKDAVERQARRELEILLSIRAGRHVKITDKVWKYWRETFIPAWSTIEEIIRIE